MKPLRACCLTALIFRLLAFVLTSTGLITAQDRVGLGSNLDILSKLPARNIGPAIPDKNGRITSIAVYEKDPDIIYVGSASGGVLKSENAGRTFQFIFDRGGSSAIGSVAVSQSDPDLVWVGTGEGWQRNDSGWGDGIYKSSDGGKTWNNMGLPKSFSFSKIVINPKNNNIVFAAVLGSQWGPGPERGVYRTSDGGTNWVKVLYVNDTTGAADLAMDPKNPKNLLAAMWDHEHRPYHYRFWGPGSGIYRSTDGGLTWHKVTEGLPQTEMGRIAFDYFTRDPRHVAACIEAKPPATSFYRSKDGGETWEEMAALPLDARGGVQKDPDRKQQQRQWYRPYYNNWVTYDRFDVNKIYQGSPRHFTVDGGKTFYGFDHDDHALWIDPREPKHMLVAGDQGVRELWDGGMPLKPGLLLDEVYLKLPPVGQFYGVGYDMRKPYWVEGGMQDDGCHMLPTQSWHGGMSIADVINGPCGDSEKNMSDPNDWTIWYTIGQSGMLFRTDLEQGHSKQIAPRPSASVNTYLATDTIEKYFRSNPRLRVSWTPAFLISPWNSNTLYYGANYLLKSVDRGDHWNIISPDLTHDNMAWQIPNQMYTMDSENSGQDIYQSIVTISESPLKQGLIWIGTDDGNIQLTLDDGAHWTNLTKNLSGLPEYTWVSHIEASRYQPGRAYATFDNHKNLDYKTYAYVTEDYGKTWTRINGNLPPHEPCYVIKEGLENPDLLFLGTERSLWVSLDRGRKWSRYERWELTDKVQGDFPTVPVYDLEEQPRELDLIIGTHGRSIWILPVRALEELRDEHLQEDVYFARPGNIYLFSVLSNSMPRQNGLFSPNTQPGTLFYYYLKHDASEKATISVTDPSSHETYAVLEGSAKAGLNVIPFGAAEDVGTNHLWTAPLPIHRPGDYRVVLTIDGKQYVQILHVEDATMNSFLTAPPTQYLPNELIEPAVSK